MTISVLHGLKIMIKRFRVGFSIMLLLLAGPIQGSETRPPNIVVLFADDLGYGDLGAYGNPYIRTPNLDQMAAEGQRWTDFYVASPVCSPSRGALLTGQYSVKTGLYGRKINVFHPNDPNGIPEALETLPEALKKAGYATGIFGKWHLGDYPENFPTRHGFDTWFGIPYSNDMDRVGAPPIDQVMQAVATNNVSKFAGGFQALIETFKDPKQEYWNVPLYRSTVAENAVIDELVERPMIQATLTERLTKAAQAFMREHQDQPFLVYLPYAMPHLPLFRGKAFEGVSLRGPYGDVVSEIDWSVGEIRQTLESLGLAENTLVFFSSDNGPWQAVSTLNAGSAGMFRGSKGTTWEGGVRVPGIFWWPEHIAPGVVSDIGTTLDVYATALTLAGVELPEGTDGVDLSEALRARAKGPRTEMPYYHRGNLTAYRYGHYKLQFYADGDFKTRLALPALYDLHQDISERLDLSAQLPEMVARIEAAVAAHQATIQQVDPIFDRRVTVKP